MHITLFILSIIALIVSGTVLKINEKNQNTSLRTILICGIFIVFPTIYVWYMIVNQINPF